MNPELNSAEKIVFLFIFYIFSVRIIELLFSYYCKAALKQSVLFKGILIKVSLQYFNYFPVFSTIVFVCFNIVM